MATFDLTAPEAWYPIPSLPGYEISSHYRVGSCWTNQGITKKTRRILKIQYQDGHRGHRAYVLARVPWDTGDKRPIQTIHVAWMVADVVIGPRPEGLMVLHKDDNPENNDPSNLYYGTKADNMEDAIRNRKWRPHWGDGKGGPKLTPEDLIAIRRLSERGVTQKAIANLFGVHRTHISKILGGHKCVESGRWSTVESGSAAGS